ncbi:uncharacterized protein LOC129730011 [Wyeomyia smithii]|uniref:uncharacterized protein LOC129730011 n=1 Tax=Wyeomyia smithii TaxID=174621 RepID=UPI002467FA40|nr:uncharacterized protein LOC129730011 [Wyeomyia smithii]
MMVTIEQLNRIVTECGNYDPVKEVVASEVVKQINDPNNGFSSNNEVAMLLAHLIHESGGFKHREEKKESRINQEYHKYHGRGYIQLTWQENYEAASMDLFGDYRLKDNPDLVLSSVKMCMEVSVWYWKAIVRKAVKNKFEDFYLTTKAINGRIENSPAHETAKTRNKYYRIAKKILDEKSNGGLNVTTCVVAVVAVAAAGVGLCVWGFPALLACCCL